MFRDTLDKGVQKNMMEAMWNINESEAGEIISKLLMRTISYNDYHENYYHAFLAGIFTGLGYEVQSNMENGLGRPDIVLRDDDNYRVMVVETKKSDKKEDMKKVCRYSIFSCAKCQLIVK